MTLEQSQGIQTQAEKALTNISQENFCKGSERSQFLIEALRKTLRLLNQTRFLGSISEHLLTPAELSRELQILANLADAGAGHIPQLQESLRNIQRLIHQPVAFALALEFADDIQQQQKALAGKATELMAGADEGAKAIGELAGTAKDAHEEIQQILGEAKEHLAAAVVAGTKGHFEQAMNGHRLTSYVWLAVTGLSAFFTIRFALELLPNGSTAAAQELSVPYLIGKVFILSVLGSLVAFAGKNYFAAQHNVVVNEHRANALGTFQSLYKSTDDKVIKDQILLEATRAMFSAQASGFSKDPDVGGRSVVEVLRDFGPRSGG